jgi:hypothetical protein
MQQSEPPSNNAKEARPPHKQLAKQKKTNQIKKSSTPTHTPEP